DPQAQFGDFAEEQIAKAGGPEQGGVIDHGKNRGRDALEPVDQEQEAERPEQADQGDQRPAGGGGHGEAGHDQRERDGGGHGRLRQGHGGGAFIGGVML